MDRDFKPPPELSLQGNPSKNWRRWRQRFELYLTATESDSKEDDIKIAQLLSAIGPEALERFNHFTWATGEDKAKYKDVMDKFQRECAGMKGGIFEISILGLSKRRRSALCQIKSKTLFNFEFVNDSNIANISEENKSIK